MTRVQSDVALSGSPLPSTKFDLPDPTANQP
jgi:hypothetical protein